MTLGSGTSAHKLIEGGTIKHNNGPDQSSVLQILTSQ